MKYRTCYKNGKYAWCIYGPKAYTWEGGHRFYGVIPLAYEVQRQLGHKFIYRLRHGNGCYGSTIKKRYQDKYTYFVPLSINNAQGQTSRNVFSASIIAWQALSKEEKETWRKKEYKISGISGYNLFIKDYFIHNYP